MGIKALTYPDKLQHIIVSCAGVIVLARFLPVPVAVCLVLFLGAIKETTDENFDLYDLGADLIGVLIGAVIA